MYEVYITLNGIHGRLDTVYEKISDLEGIEIEAIQNETEKKELCFFFLNK